MDVQLHHFNALQECFGLGAVEARAQDSPPEVAAEVRRLVWNSLQSIKALLEEIEWKQHAEIIADALVTSLRETTHRVLVQKDTEEFDTGAKIMGYPLGVLLRNPGLVLAVLPFFLRPQQDEMCLCCPAIYPGSQCLPEECGGSA